MDLPRCVHCGVEEDMPFECSYCGAVLCGECRLPENHACEKIARVGWAHASARVRPSRARRPARSRARKAGAAIAALAVVLVAAIMLDISSGGVIASALAGAASLMAVPGGGDAGTAESEAGAAARETTAAPIGGSVGAAAGDARILPGTVRYSIDPDYPASTNRVVAFAAVGRGLDLWAERNDFEFERVEADPDITIRLSESIPGGGVGLYKTVCPLDVCTSYGELERHIEVEIGGEDCRGEWHHYSALTISSTVAHEFGHAVGIGHTADESHLMFGFSRPAPEPVLDELGYDVPDDPSVYGSTARWEELNAERAPIKARYDELVARYDALQAEYAELSGYTAVLRRGELADEINSLAGQINSLIYKLDSLGREQNCLAGYSR